MQFFSILPGAVRIELSPCFYFLKNEMLEKKFRKLRESQIQLLVDQNKGKNCGQKYCSAQYQKTKDPQIKTL